MIASASSFSIPHLPNVSLVAFYQRKPSQLTNLIQKLLIYLTKSKIIKAKFISYQLEQIHATIIGCEGLTTPLGIINKWFYEYRQETRYLNLSGWLDYLQKQVDFPLTIRFGGYQTGVDYNFLSREQHPSIRSFQLRSSGEDIIIPVLMGWSFANKNITWEIENIRRQAQQFNLLHKYHQFPQSIDNDFYLRLGTITGKLETKEMMIIEQEIKEILQSQSVNISLRLDDLAFVKYQHLTLPLATTEILPVVEATEDKLQQLYI
jgi:hypothetical protein